MPCQYILLGSWSKVSAGLTTLGRVPLLYQQSMLLSAVLLHLQQQAMHQAGRVDSGGLAGRPPIPLLCFGFGGKTVTMHPRPSPVLGADGQRKLAVGPVCLHSPGHAQQSQASITALLRYAHSCQFAWQQISSIAWFSRAIEWKPTLSLIRVGS